MKAILKTDGYSLSELVISIAISTIVILLLASPLVNLIDLQKKSSEKLDYYASRLLIRKFLLGKTSNFTRRSINPSTSFYLDPNDGKRLVNQAFTDYSDHSVILVGSNEFNLSIDSSTFFTPVINQQTQKLTSLNLFFSRCIDLNHINKTINYSSENEFLAFFNSRLFPVTDKGTIYCCDESTINPRNIPQSCTFASKKFISKTFKSKLILDSNRNFKFESFIDLFPIKQISNITGSGFFINFQPNWSSSNNIGNRSTMSIFTQKNTCKTSLTKKIYCKNFGSLTADNFQSYLKQKEIENTLELDVEDSFVHIVDSLLSSGLATSF